MKFDKIYNKTIEELMELSTVMLQQKNKKNNNYSLKIEEEIADVYCWLDLLKTRFDQDRINRRISYKRRKNKIKI